VALLRDTWHRSLAIKDINYICELRIPGIL
jgi:hypothetical protein